LGNVGDGHFTSIRAMGNGHSIGVLEQHRIYTIPKREKYFLFNQKKVKNIILTWCKSERDTNCLRLGLRFNLLALSGSFSNRSE